MANVSSGTGGRLSLRVSFQRGQRLFCEALDLFLTLRIMRHHELQANVRDSNLLEHLQSVDDLFNAAL